jgi:hypothetical protein
LGLKPRSSFLEVESLNAGKVKVNQKHSLAFGKQTNKVHYDKSDF